MKISLSDLKYTFLKKPLLVGGMAMQYYGLRPSGKDIDLIATEKDIINLIKLYPDRVKDLWGDLGVCPFEFEIWKTIHYMDYSNLIFGAIDEGEFLVISKEKLLLTKTLAMHKEKYLIDTKLIVESILREKSKMYNRVKSNNDKLLKEISGIHYIEKSGPKI